MATVNISYASEEEIAEYFRFLQNQEVLRAGEIINSIPDTHLQKYLDKVQDIDKLMDILGYSNNRKEFDKLFYSIIGLYDKQINFGTTNKCIKEYVFNKKTDLEGDALTQTLKMINNLNKVLSVDCKFKANKRFIKMLLLLAGFEAIDFNDNLDIKLKNWTKLIICFQVLIAPNAMLLIKLLLVLVIKKLKNIGLLHYLINVLKLIV